MSYCCFEPGCHLPFAEPGDWIRLRALAARRGVSLSPDPLRLDVHGLVHAGARWDHGVNRSDHGYTESLAKPPA